MARWTKTTKRQRGRVKAHEAKDDGRQARREQDKDAVKEGLEEYSYGHELLLEYRSHMKKHNMHIGSYEEIEFLISVINKMKRQLDDG